MAIANFIAQIWTRFKARRAERGFTQRLFERRWSQLPQHLQTQQ